MRIILASGSPRRKELLQLITSDFEIIVSNIDETLDKNLTLENQVSELAYSKAKSVFDKLDGDRIVIGADTIVTKNNEIYGKPKDKANAKEMLKKLLEGDRAHEVITGVSVIMQKDNQYQEIKTYDKAKVYFTEISDTELDKWVDSGKALDKAGAYGIQTEFCAFVEKIDGNYDTVVGLPVYKIYQILKKYHAFA